MAPEVGSGYWERVKSPSATHPFFILDVTGMKKNRPSANVCTVCRNRKVKCDGRPGGCENCARLNYRCSFSVPDFEEGTPAALEIITDIARKRTRLACQPCKLNKARCSGEQPSCQRCNRRHFECVYLPSKRAIKNPSLSDTSVEPMSATSAVFSGDLIQSVEDTATNSTAASPDDVTNFDDTNMDTSDDFQTCYDSMNADKSTVKRCIDAFFNVLYSSPEYSFIHKAVFLQMWQAGDIDSVLLKAVCGVAARFVPDQTQAIKDQAATWIDEAQAELLSSFEKPAVVRLQALQLVVLHCQAMRRFRRLLFLFSICTRMAFLLRLNYEDTTLPFLAQESRRRLMWSIYVVDTFLAGGMPDFTLVPTRKIHIRLPAEEPSFQLDRAVDTEPLHPEPGQAPSTTIGLLAYFIRVIDIRNRILRYTKEISDSNIDTKNMASRFQEFEFELERLKGSLPPNMSFSAKNLSLRAYSKNSLPRFVMLHVWWHQCHCDLFRFLIPGFRESVSEETARRIPSDLSQYCRSQCVAHARSLADIFHLLLNLDQDVPITDAGLAVPAYQCANILSRSPSMRGVDGPFNVKGGVQACLEFTKQLAQYNHMAAVIKEDIQKLVDYGTPSKPINHIDSHVDASSPASVISGAENPKFAGQYTIDAASVRDDGADLSLRNAVSTLSPASEEPQRPTSAPWTNMPMQQPMQHHHPGIPPQPVPQQFQTQMMPPPPQDPLHPLQQQAALQQATIQQTYAPPNHIMNLNETNDWTWDMPLPGNEGGTMDFLFDPLWRIHNQWDIGLNGR